MGFEEVVLRMPEEETDEVRTVTMRSLQFKHNLHKKKDKHLRK